MTTDLKTQGKTLFNLDLSDSMLAAFEQYSAQLIDWSQRINLTSITDPDEIRVKHFLDSLSLLSIPNLPDAVHLIDVGTGAGLPGIPLKIVRPNWQVTLLDATGKKVNFLKQVIVTLGLQGIAAEQARAEDAGQDKRHRDRYGLVVGRAVARLPILLEYLLPLCEVGGLCVAMKGETAQAEADDSANALRILGGELEAIHAIHLPEVEQVHYLVCIRKIKTSPTTYPRRAGLPSKSPL